MRNLKKKKWATLGKMRRTCKNATKQLKYIKQVKYTKRVKYTKQLKYMKK